MRYYSRVTTLWRLPLVVVLILLILYGGVELFRRNLPQQTSEELQHTSKPQSVTAALPCLPPEPCNCDTKKRLSDRRFDPTSLASMQLQTRREVIEELQNNWLKPPSLEPYNVNSTENRTDMDAVRKLHKSVLRILNEKRNGFFVECGAFDGAFLSNTLHLEQSYGWTGLLVEADPLTYENLVQAHRKAWIINACLGIRSMPEKVNMTRLKDDRLRTLLSEVDPVFKNQPNTEEFQAQCFPLGSILAALGQSLNVDYLSLDVERAELAILSTVPWDFVYIKVISVECHPWRCAPLKAYLEYRNYVFVGWVKGVWVRDLVFVHSFYREEEGFQDKEVQNIISNG